LTRENFDPVAYNRAAWDREVDQGNEWTLPVGPDVIARARAGDWSVVLIGYEPVPHDWFPADMTGTKVLCLASGGGQQGPVRAAAGADVTGGTRGQAQLIQRPVEDRPRRFRCADLTRQDQGVGQRRHAELDQEIPRVLVAVADDRDFDAVACDSAH